MSDKRIMTFEYNAGDVQAPIFLDEFDNEYRGIQLAPIVVGVGYVQATMSTHSAVDSNAADWVNWPAGSVSTATQDTINPTITAIRVYRSSGALRLDVRLV